jgi:molecular chaperone DnaK
MILGIDLGTTNTAAAIIKNGEPVYVKTGNPKHDFLLPSVVAYVNKGKFLVGHKALELLTTDPESVIRSVKSIIGTNQEIPLKNQHTEVQENFSPVEISAQILGEIKRLAEKQFKTSIEKAVITVPAYFNDNARKDTIKAGELAGFEVMRILNEPTAAALTYGTENSSSKKEHIMVYDLGGGTFDTSIIELNGDVVEVIASDGDRNLGGDNFDYALFSYIYGLLHGEKNPAVKSLKAMAAILNEAEQTKNKLSSAAKHKIEIKSLKFEETIYREDLEKLICDLLKKTVNHCKAVIARSKLKNTDIEKILLVGGSSRVPAVKEMLESELSIPVSQEIDPDLAVVIGAAVQAAIIEGQKVNSVLLDVAPHSLSVSCVLEKGGKTINNYCNKLIKKNTPIPCTIEEVFSTLNDNQDTVRVAIYQGESDFEEGNTLIRELKFDGIKKRKAGETEIMVRFSYRLDGTIDIQVAEEGTQNISKETLKLLNKKSGTEHSVTIH